MWTWTKIAMAFNKHNTQNLKIKTYSWFSDILSVACLHDSADEGFNASHLADYNFVSLVVTSQVGEYARSTGDHIDVVAGQ